MVWHHLSSFNMKKIFCCLTITLTLMVSSVKTAHAGLVDTFTSPVTTPAIFMFLGGSILTYAVYQEKGSYTDKVEADINNDKPMKRYSHYGDLLGQLAPNLVFATGELLFGNNGRAIHMFDATIGASMLTLILKYTVRENRPDRSDRLSFPSGHTATAFAFASVVGTHYRWPIALPAYMIAAGVGFSRVNDKKHHIHDVIAGMTIGMSYGYGTYYLNRIDYSIADNDDGVKFFPVYSSDKVGLMASYKF